MLINLKGKIIMNKTKIVANIADKTGYTRAEVGAVIEEFIAQVTEGLANGEVVRVASLGKFEVRERKARTAVNPRTGRTMEIANLTIPAFRPGKPFIENINKK